MSTFLDEPDTDEDEATPVSTLTPEEIEDVKAKILTFKTEGDGFFRTQSFEDSVTAYSECIKLAKANGLPPDAVILANRSAGYLALKRYVPACHDAIQSAKVDPTNWKAHWRN